MRQGAHREHLTSLAALLMLAVFAVSILFALLAGASVYRRVVDRNEASWSSRTAEQYIATRIRQEDRLNAIAVEDFGGLDALVLGVNEDYQTRLYCYDGSLWELYADASLALDPADGERLLDLEGMELSLESGLLQVELTAPGGSSRHLTLDTRSGEVAS